MQPIVSSLQDIGQQFIRVEQQRDQLLKELEEARGNLSTLPYLQFPRVADYKIDNVAELSSRAIADKEDATRQAEKYKAALKQTMTSAKKCEEELLAQTAEREDQLTNHLVPLADTLSGEFL